MNWYCTYARKTNAPNIANKNHLHKRHITVKVAASNMLPQSLAVSDIHASSSRHFTRHGNPHHRAPLGDPLEIRLRGYSLALRPSEADALEFEVVES